MGGDMTTFWEQLLAVLLLKAFSDVSVEFYIQWL
jgi:hypothetical protein